VGLYVLLTLAMPPRSKRQRSSSAVEDTDTGGAGGATDANRLLAGLATSTQQAPIQALTLLDLPAPVLARVLRFLPVRDAVAFRAVARGVHTLVGPSIEALAISGAALAKLDAAAAGATDVLRLKSLRVDGACEGWGEGRHGRAREAGRGRAERSG
jgi:hypothetical protein